MRSVFASAVGWGLAVSLAGGVALACEAPSPASTVSLRQLSDISLALSGIAEKDEFESTSEFQARVAAERGSILKREGLDPVLPWVIEAPLADHLRYDAEAHRLTIENLGVDFSGLMPVSLKSGGYHGSLLATEVRKESSYSAVNGFGAELQVMRQDVDLLAFAWPKGSVKITGLKMNNLAKPVVLNGVGSTEARALRDEGVIRVIGTPEAPYFERAPTIGASPTFQNPLDRRNWFAAFLMKPTAVCVVAPDGRILDRWNIQPAR